MASIDTSLVREDIKKLISISDGLKKRTKSVFKQLEKDPSTFPPLKYVPPSIRNRYTNLEAIRKAKIRSGKHDYRMIFAHWIVEDEQDPEHVDGLLVFPRKDGYQIDWDWIESTLDCLE